MALKSDPDNQHVNSDPGRMVRRGDEEGMRGGGIGGGRARWKRKDDTSERVKGRVLLKELN